MIYAIPNKIYTLNEYFELDFMTDAKYEFFDGKLVEISGVAINHARIEMNILGIFYEVLTQDFESWIGSMKLKVPSLPPYRYPNFSVSPKKGHFEMVGKHHCLVNPIVIGEIYSPATKVYDCGEKYEAYKSIETFREYFLIDQNRKFVTLYTKYHQEIWLQSEYGEGETFTLESLDCELSLDEIYRGIIFETETNS